VVKEVQEVLVEVIVMVVLMEEEVAVEVQYVLSGVLTVASHPMQYN
jgi:hypothetical protein